MKVDIEDGYVLANGARFHYYRTPLQYSGSRPVLVLQHGSSDNGLCWEPVARELAGAYDILMPDARGHGRSSRLIPGEPLDQVADLVSLLRTLGMERVIVAGHSMGAQIASGLAARHPGLVRAAILEDPPWLASGPQTEQGVQTSTDDAAIVHWTRVQEQPLNEIVEGYRAENPFWLDSYLLPWCQGKKEWDLNFLRMTLPWGAGWRDEVASFACPVLLVTADPSHGGIVTPEVAAMAAGRNPHIQIARFPGVGHHIRFAAHTAYMQRVGAFLEHVALCDPS